MDPAACRDARRRGAGRAAFLRPAAPPGIVPAYVVALIESISDPETYKSYVAQVEATLAPFGGRFLARKPDPAVLEGAFTPSRAVVLEFPDEAAVRAWHASPAYQPVLRLRQSASKGTLLLLPGHADAAAARRVAMRDVCYVELVTADVEAMRRACEQTHGWAFAAPDEALGGAVVATLRGGARCAIRAPLDATEKPVTRAYVRVADADEAVKRAEGAGAMIALPVVALPGHGRIAICIVGGVEHGLWELP